MRILKRSIALLLFICMMFTTMPAEFLQAAFAETLGKDTPSLGVAGVSNTAGGVYKGDQVGFRIQLSRDSENFLNGTQTQRDVVLNYYSNKWPDGYDYGNNTIFFAGHTMYEWLYDRVKPGNAANSGGNVGIYLPGALSDARLPVYDTFRDLVIQGSTSTSVDLKNANKFKNYALQLYDAGTIKDLGDFGNNIWLWGNGAGITNQGFPSGSEALNVLSTIFARTGGTYKVVENINKFIEGNSTGLFSKDPSLMTEREKFEVSAGYAGLLMCFYSVIASSDTPNRASTSSTFETGINDYLLNANTEQKPVTLVIDTAIAMVENPLYYYITPTIDMIQYMALTNETEVLTNHSGQIVNENKIKNDTKELIREMYQKAVNRVTFAEVFTGAENGDTGKPIRFADYNFGNMTAYKSHAISHAHDTFFFETDKNSYKGVIENTKNNKITTAGYATDDFPGYLTYLRLDNTRDIYGFILVGNHLATPEPTMTYYVEDEIIVPPSGCSTEVQPSTLPKITVTIDGDSSFISSMNHRANDPNFTGIRMQATVKRTEYRNGFDDSCIYSVVEHVDMLEQQLNRTLLGEELLYLLSGNAIILEDTSLLTDNGENPIFEKSEVGTTSIRYVYDINIDVFIDKAEYYFGTPGSDDKERTPFVVTSSDGTKYNFAEFVIPQLQKDIPMPEHIEIPKPSSSDTTEIFDPSEPENLAENNQMIKRHQFSSGGAQFAEIKNNVPLQEQYEVMAGVPSTEELYYSVGGNEFQVALVVQHWMNEHSRDRTYTVHFDGNVCEYNNQEKGKGDSWVGVTLPTAEGAVMSTTRLEHADTSDPEKSIEYPTGMSNGKNYGTLEVTATWTGTIKNDATAVTESNNHGSVTAKCPAQVNQTDYLNAIAQANAWMKAMSDFSKTDMKWTAASDKVERVIVIDTMSTTGNPNTTQAHSDSGSGSTSYKNSNGNTLMTGNWSFSYSNPKDTSATTGSACYSTGGENPTHVHVTKSATAQPGEATPYTITVTYKIEPHALCGPCCGHVMPELWDTWRQGMVFDFAKIAQIRLYKLDQGSVDGLKELVGVETVFASVRSGNPTYFMNIAQMTEKKRYGQDILPNFFDTTESSADNIEQKGLTASTLKDVFITYLGTGKVNSDTLTENNFRTLAQSSRAGRLRYTLAEGQNTETITITEQGNGTGGTYTFDPNLIAAPDQHDDVIYNVGQRSKNCDGMATTNNFGKLSSKNDKPAELTGHVNEWADGCLYTNIMEKTVQAGIPGCTTNTSAYSGYWDSKLYSATVDTQKFEENTLQTYTKNDIHYTKYKEDYNHHVVRPDVLSAVSTDMKKTAYNDAADERDTQTAEWQFFNKARRTKIVGHVISDFLILQTSGGDQSIFYYEKASEPTEAQEHFQKVIIEHDELFYNNPLSIFIGDVACEDGEGAKQQYTKDFIIVGGYNGQYNEVDDKYRPYNMQDGEFKKFYDEGWNVYNATEHRDESGNYATTGFLGNTEIKTILDDDPAKTIKRPERQAKNQGTSFKIYQDNIQILPTSPNKLYTPGSSKVFYSQVLGYYSIDRDVIDARDRSNIIGTIGNVSIGWPQQEKHGEYYKKYWGSGNGVDYTTKYFMLPMKDAVSGDVFSTATDSGSTTVNPVVVYTPVSTEDAIVMELDKFEIDVNGQKSYISRDQRVNNFEYPNMNDLVNALKVCPLDPELCEYRYLDCKFHDDTVLAEFDFEETYVEKEIRRVKQADGTVKQEITYGDTLRNTYHNGTNWVTTDKVSGVEYMLPAGFNVGNYGKVGSTKELYANGTRWALPLNSLGLSTNKSNMVEVEMDLTVDSTANNLMLASFYNYGFVLNPTNTLGSFIARSEIDNSQIGPRMDADYSTSLNKVKVKIKFGFNNVVDCEASINGVPANLTVSDLRKVWKDEEKNGVKTGVRVLVTEPVEVTDWINEAPRNLTVEDIGTNLIIGSWGSNNNYKANYYLDNLKITLKGGSTEHNSTCYERLTVHQTKRIHVHDEDCYLKEDMYTCSGELNGNYQHGDDYSYNSHVCTSSCKTSITSGASTEYYYTSHYDTQYITGYVVKLGSYSYIWPGSGEYVYTYGSQCSRNTNMPNSVLHSNASSGYTTLSTTTYPGSSGHSTIVYKFKLTDSLTLSNGNLYIDNCNGELNTHVHEGVAGKDYPSGCYTKPTIHIHNKIPQVLICGKVEGSGGTPTDFSYKNSVQQITLQPGRYQLEVWGAQGGTYGSGSKNPGEGGYSTGILNLNQADTLYIVTGGQGSTTTGGYNGGGNSSSGYGGGGGATHIGLKSGLLTSFSSDYSTQLLLVAGGGGGCEYSADDGYGGAGGGESGQAGYQNGATNSAGGTQTTGASFGAGGSVSGTHRAGGGGGFYGGYASASSDRNAGGGSGYVNKSLLTDTNTIVGNTSFLSPTGTSEIGHSGNGYARITPLNHTHTQDCYGVVTDSTSLKELTCGKPVGGDGQVRTYSTVGTSSVTLGAGRYRIEVWGAQGGNAASATYAGGTGGLGGYSIGEVTLNQSTTYQVVVGGQGQSYNTNYSVKYGGAGGFGGGGSGGQPWMSGSVSGGAGGGGLSGVFTSTSYTSSALIIAGGGGGGGGSASSSGSNHGAGTNGGYGGGETGGTGVHTLSGTTTVSHKSQYSGKGGTQSAGGAATNQNSVAGGKLYGGGGGGISSGNSGNATTLAGGAAPTASNSSSSAGGSGGGGGGYYGGSGGGQYGLGGGGGSGYVNLNILDSGTTYGGNTSFSNTAGTGNETGHSGNGYVKITSLDHQHTDACYTTSNITVPEGYYAVLKCGQTAGGSDYVGEFTHKESIQSVNLSAGKYKLEVWGAQGGANPSGQKGGKGGYTSGILTLNSSDTLYIAVGGQGAQCSASGSINPVGGYNGGGYGYQHSGCNGGSAGGGATHIGLKSGLLTSFSSDYSTQLLLVAGGGGGAGYSGAGGAGAGGNNSGTAASSGGSAGGTSSGYSFGKGEGGTVGGSSGTGSRHSGAGGGGFYGGYAATNNYGGGGGSGYANTSKLTEISYTSGTREGSGYAKITGLGHTHTADCYDFIEIPKCDVLEKGELVCHGRLNATTDYNVHIHTAACLTDYAEIDTRMLRYTGGVQTFVVPYTDEYTFEAYGPEYQGRTGYARATLSLKKDQVLYIYVGGTGGYNEYSTDIRVSPPPSGQAAPGEEATWRDQVNLSKETRVISAGDRQGSANTFVRAYQNCTPINGITGMRGGDGNGRVIITCKNTQLNPTIYQQIINGDMSLEDAKTYLGEPLYNKILEGKEGLLHTWQSWSNSNTKGFVESNNATLLYGGGYICGKTEGDADVPIEFPYTGSVQEHTLPAGEYKLEVWGAEGGSGTDGTSTASVGGKGGYSVGTINLNSSTKLYVYAGGKGSIPSASVSGGGGFNGGGNGYTGSSYTSTKYLGAGGGGASDIRIGTDNLYYRVIVAGGGGGSTNGSSDSNVRFGGVGGGAQGGSAKYTGSGYSGDYTLATGGSQSLGGSSGGFGSGDDDKDKIPISSFGNGGYVDSTVSSSASGAGGGGGFYGGGASSWGPGGGGSGYVLTSTSTKPSGYKLGSEYYLTDAQTIAGDTEFTAPDGSKEIGHSGDGYVRITPLSHTHTDDCIDGSIGGGTATTLTCGIPVGGDGQVRTYSTVGETSVNLPAGRYRIEAWGAEGGTGSFTAYDTNAFCKGGLGGYSKGELILNTPTNIFINIGGKGDVNNSGGYNGGGYGGYCANNTWGSNDGKSTASGGSGGGATHIALSSGLLSTFSSNYTSQVLLVAGGGGGGGRYLSISGGYGGGESGGIGTSTAGNESDNGGGGTQSSGGLAGQGDKKGNPGVFGQGGQGIFNGANNNPYVSGGGGGGLYGGGSGGTDSSIGGASGGGGSGYVNPNLLKSGTYETIAGNTSFPNTAGTGNETGHSGNGFVKITSLDHQHTQDCYTTVQIPDGYVLDCNITEGHTHNNNCFKKVDSIGNLTVYAEGKNAQFEVPLGNIPVEAISKIVVYGNNIPQNIGTIYLKDATGSYNANDIIKSDIITPNTEGQVMTFDFIAANNKNLTGNLTALKFELANVIKTFEITKIEVYGFGEKVDGTGENSNNSDTPLTYTYKGSYETKTLSKGKYKVELYGASGGNNSSSSSANKGSNGTYVRGTLELSSNTPVYIYVGGQGKIGNNTAGGWNGGGKAGGCSCGSGSGGGASDIRIGGTDLSNRVMVAGGGGGAGDPGSPGQTTAKSCGTLGTGDYGHTSNDGGGGGGGYHGGYTGHTVDAGGYIGTSYVNNTEYTSNVSTDTYEVKHNNNLGNGKIVITPLDTFTPLEITYVDPLDGCKTIIDANINLIPDKINGDYNPIWLCKFKEYNFHSCEMEDKNGNIVKLCKTHVLFNCTEPHHRGEHYSGSNRICWSACGDDSKHANTKKEVQINGETVKLSEFVQLDAAFTVYFPNIGNFEGNNAHGLAAPQITRGMGYTDNMDTTQWTREKRVKFPFEVIFDDKENGEMLIHGRNTWIELDVETEYFNFYVLSSNPEMSNVKVQFEVEAINCGTSSGIKVKRDTSADRNKNQPYLMYYSSTNANNVDASVDKIYADKITAFQTNYINVLFNAVKEGYQVSYPSVGFGDSTTSGAFTENGFLRFYEEKKNGIEEDLRTAMQTTDSRIERDFEGSNSNKWVNNPKKDDIDKIWPHTKSGNGINDNLKDITSNDNKKRVDNRMRSNSLESLHGGYKSFYLDVIGRIGNFAVTDTDDYRFSNFFKMPVSKMGALDMKNANNWLVEGVVEKVRDDIQNFYIGDTYDIRGNKASVDTRWLDTYNTQKWMTGVLNTATLERDIDNPNLKSQILTGEVNNVAVLQDEELRFGYDTYTSINTLGSYTSGNVQIIPKYYALKLTNNVGNDSFDREKGTFVALDVYISKDGLYTPVNIFGNAANGKPNIQGLTLNDFAYNLDWTTESGRRNYTLEEKERTMKIQEMLTVFDYGDVDLDGVETDEIDDILAQIEPDVFKLKIPNGKNNYMGSAQYMLLDGKHRTFIGTSESWGGNTYKSKAGTTDWGTDKNIGKVIHDTYFEKAVQRWHGKLGVPSSSVFVPHDIDGDPNTMTPVNASTIEYVMNDEWAIVCTAEIIAIGDVWSISYSQPWFRSMVINNEPYKTSEHYPGHRIYNGKDSIPCPNCVPPIIAVYSSDSSSVDDIEIVQTH